MPRQGYLLVRQRPQNGTMPSVGWAVAVLLIGVVPLEAHQGTTEAPPRLTYRAWIEPPSQLPGLPVALYVELHNGTDKPLGYRTFGLTGGMVVTPNRPDGSVPQTAAMRKLGARLSPFRPGPDRGEGFKEEELAPGKTYKRMEWLTWPSKHDLCAPGTYRLEVRVTDGPQCAESWRWLDPIPFVVKEAEGRDEEARDLFVRGDVAAFFAPSIDNRLMPWKSEQWSVLETLVEKYSDTPYGSVSAYSLACCRWVRAYGENPWQSRDRLTDEQRAYLEDTITLLEPLGRSAVTAERETARFEIAVLRWWLGEEEEARRIVAGLQDEGVPEPLRANCQMLLKRFDE